MQARLQENCWHEAAAEAFPFTFTTTEQTEYNAKNVKSVNHNPPPAPSRRLLAPMVFLISCWAFGVAR